MSVQKFDPAPIVKPYSPTPYSGVLVGHADVANGPPIQRIYDFAVAIKNPEADTYHPSVAAVRMVTLLTIPQRVANTKNAYENYKGAVSRGDRDGWRRALVDMFRGVCMMVNAGVSSAANALQVARLWVWNATTRRVNNGLGTAMAGFMIFNSIYQVCRRLQLLYLACRIRSQLHKDEKGNIRTPDEKIAFLKKYIKVTEGEVQEELYTRPKTNPREQLPDNAQMNKKIREWVIAPSGGSLTDQSPELTGQKKVAIAQEILKKQADLRSEEKENALLQALGSDVSNARALLDRVKNGAASSEQLVAEVNTALTKTQVRCVISALSFICGIIGHTLNLLILTSAIAVTAINPWVIPIILIIVAMANYTDDTRVWLRQLELGARGVDKPFSYFSCFLNVVSYFIGIALNPADLVGVLISIMMSTCWLAANYYTWSKCKDKELADNVAATRALAAPSAPATQNRGAVARAKPTSTEPSTATGRLLKKRFRRHRLKQQRNRSEESRRVSVSSSSSSSSHERSHCRRSRLSSRHRREAV